MSNGPVSLLEPTTLRTITLINPIRGSSNWIHAIADNSEGMVIGTRIRLAIHARAGIAVRSNNHARRIAAGNPTANDPTVKTKVSKKMGKVAGLVNTAT